MKPNKDAKKGGAKLHRAMTAIVLLLVLASAAISGACIYYSHLLQGVTILLCDIGIVGLLLIASSGKKSRVDAKSSKKRKKFNGGNVLLTAKNADCKLRLNDDESIESSGTVSVLEGGIEFEIGGDKSGYSWQEVAMYQLGEDFVFIGFESGEVLALRNLTKLKVRAFDEQLHAKGIARLNAE